MTTTMTAPRAWTNTRLFVSAFLAFGALGTLAWSSVALSSDESMADLGWIWLAIIGCAVTLGVAAAVLNLAEVLRWYKVVRRDFSVAESWTARIQDPVGDAAYRRAMDLPLDARSSDLARDLQEVRSLSTQGRPVDWGVYETGRLAQADLSFRSGRTFATSLLILAVMATFAGFLEVAQVENLESSQAYLEILERLKPAFFANLVFLLLSVLIAISSFFGTLGTQAHARELASLFDHWVYPVFEAPRSDAATLQQASQKLLEATRTTQESMQQRLNIDRNLDQVAQSLVEARHRLDDLLAQSRTSLDGLKDSLKTSIERPLTLAKESHDKSADALTQVASAMDEGVRRNSETLEALAAAVTSWKSVAKALDGIERQVSDHLTAIREHAEKSTVELERRERASDAAESAIGRAVEELRQNSISLGDRAESAAAAMEAVVEQLDVLLQREQSSSIAITHSLEVHRESLARFNEEISKTFQDKLVLSVDRIVEALNVIPPVLEAQLREATTAIGDLIMESADDRPDDREYEPRKGVLRRLLSRLTRRRRSAPSSRLRRRAFGRTM